MVQNAEDDEDDDGAERGKKQARVRGAEAAVAEADQITRGSKGIIMPARNAFDFVDRPRRDTGDDVRGMGSAGQSKGHEKIKKAMNTIKRLSKTSFVNRRM